MPDVDPHTADLVDEDPDRRRVPRPASEGSNYTGGIRDSRAPSAATSSGAGHARGSAGVRALDAAEASTLLRLAFAARAEARQDGGVDAWQAFAAYVGALEHDLPRIPRA